MSNVSCKSNVSDIASLPDIESNPRRPARNALEGVVERHPLLSMQGAQGYRLLAFWRRPADVDAYEGL